MRSVGRNTLDERTFKLLYLNLKRKSAMLEKTKQLFKKAFELLKKYYVFLACLFFVLIGVDMVDSRYWGYNDTDSEIIGGHIVTGLKVVAGSILVGTSLLSLAILRKNNTK